MYYKKSEPHKASVTGDTVGDPFKDTSGPSMNILIKLMSIVSLVIAPYIAVSSDQMVSRNPISINGMNITATSDSNSVEVTVNTDSLRMKLQRGSSALQSEMQKHVDSLQKELDKRINEQMKAVENEN